MLSCCSQGSSILYRKFVHPWLAKHEKVWDTLLFLIHVIAVLQASPACNCNAWLISSTHSVQQAMQGKKPLIWNFNSFWKWYSWEAFQTFWVKKHSDHYLCDILVLSLPWNNHPHIYHRAVANPHADPPFVWDWRNFLPLQDIDSYISQAKESGYDTFVRVSRNTISIAADTMVKTAVTVSTTNNIYNFYRAYT